MGPSISKLTEPGGDISDEKGMGFEGHIGIVVKMNLVLCHKDNNINTFISSVVSVHHVILIQIK